MTRVLTEEQRQAKNRRSKAYRAKHRAANPLTPRPPIDPEERAERYRDHVRRYRERQALAAEQEEKFKAGTLTLLPPLGTWTDRAVCADKDIPTEWFWVPGDRPRVAPEDLLLEQRTVAHICGGCPVRTECLDEGRRNRFGGVWGGVMRANNGTSEYDLVALHRAGELTTPAGTRSYCGRPATTTKGDIAA